MDSKKYMGMDVHKESLSIAVMNGAGKIVMECVIETKASMILATDIAFETARIIGMWESQRLGKPRFQVLEIF